MKNDRRLLNIVAPNFEPDIVGGAGEVLIQLTENFLRLHPNVRIYLNENAAIGEGFDAFGQILPGERLATG